MDRHHLDRSARALIKSPSISITFKENYVILFIIFTLQRFKIIKNETDYKNTHAEKKMVNCGFKKRKKEKEI